MNIFAQEGQKEMVSQAVVRSTTGGQALNDSLSPSQGREGTPAQGTFRLTHHDRKCSVLYRDYLRVIEKRCTNITEITMSPKKVYQLTRPLIYSAAHMLGAIAFRLNGILHPEMGVKLSYRQITEDLIGEYSEDFIAVAGRLLVQVGLVESPTQDHTTRRAFIWKVPREQVQQALAELSHPTTDISDMAGKRALEHSSFERDRKILTQQKNDTVRPSTPAIADVDEGYTGSPTHTYTQCNESESQNTSLKQKREESDSIYSNLFPFFSSTAWSPEIVKAIIVALEVMPERKWERAIVDEQCQIVYEQLRKHPPQEACRRLILSLEYMKSTQPFWKARFQQGRPIVLSLGTNKDGTHHHCLEMYEELTRRRWASTIEEAWLAEEMTRSAERGTCARLAIKALHAQGVSTDNLEFEELVEIGRPLYEQERARWDAEIYEEAEAEETTVIEEQTGPHASTQVEVGGSAHQEKPSSPRDSLVTMDQDQAFALAASIAEALPNIRPYIFWERTEQGEVSLCLTPPWDGQGGVRLTNPSDWELLSQALEEAGGNWNVAMTLLFGDPEPAVEHAHQEGKAIHRGVPAGMSEGEGIALADRIAAEFPSLAPYLFWGPTRAEEFVTLDLAPPSNSGEGIRLTSPSDWEQLSQALEETGGDWDATLALLFDNPEAPTRDEMTPSKASAREQNPKKATSPELIGQKKAHVSAVPGVSEEDAQIIIDLMNRKDQEEPERDLMLSIRSGGPVLLVRYS